MQQLIVIFITFLAIAVLENVSCLKKNKVQLTRVTKLHFFNSQEKKLYIKYNKAQLSTDIKGVNIMKFTKLHLISEERDVPKLEYIASNDKPSISVLSDEELKQLAKKESVTTIPTKPSTQGSRKTKVSTTFGSLSQNDLRQRRDESAILRGMNRKTINGKEDLNGINPSTPFLFSTVPFVMSIAGWQITTYLAGHFATELLDSDLYPLQRAAIIARNLIVGMSTLATGFCGVVSLGLVLLGIAVTIGVAKGELDPNKPRT